LTKRQFPLEKIGLLLTAAYLISVFTIVVIFWEYLSGLEPNAWGDFLAETFGPLALAWIVLGFFLQSRELQHSVDALRLQAEELRNSVEQQKAMVAVSNEQLALEIETRDRLDRNERAETTPFFTLLYSKNLSMSIGLLDREYLDLTLQNLGGSAKNVELIFEDGRLSVGSLGKGERKQVGHRVVQTTLGFAIVKATAQCVDLKGEAYLQKLDGNEVTR